MIGKILIATLAAATLSIATSDAAVIANGMGTASGKSTVDAMRTEGIRYDGIRVPQGAVRLAGSSAPHNRQF